MTWQEYFDILVKRGAGEDNAANVVGHLMDLYEQYDWNSEIPFEA